MKVQNVVLAGVALVCALTSSIHLLTAQTNTVGSGKIKHVLLLSIDGIMPWTFTTARMALRA
ncbi:MAG: hypothetical protein ABSF97_09235 [Candidatus Sulfotelmatobacter sp.]|jgi:hypothetical protein